MGIAYFLCNIHPSRYLEGSFLQSGDTLDTQHPQFVSEFHSQKETIGSLLSIILTDSDAVVKRVLVSTKNSLESLCVYFGRSKAHDILLSHLITFLNDKDDFQLRIAFFQCVPAVASFIGWQAAPLLIPLLKQGIIAKYLLCQHCNNFICICNVCMKYVFSFVGLWDVEEFVTRESLLTIKSLAEINFFGHRFLLDLLEETLPFVIHPNLWLRNACVGVIRSIKDNLSQVDVHCHVIPRLRAYLNPSSPAIWAVNEISILSKVRKPLERQVYESCARAKSVLLNAVIDYLKSNDAIRGKEPDSVEVRNVSILCYFVW